MKRVIVLGLIVLMSGLFFSSGVFAQEKVKVGIVMFSSESGYPVSSEGILSGLKKAGFDETNADFDIRNAKGNNENVTLIATEFMDKNVNIIMPIGTPAAIGVYKVNKNIPIVFSNVFDPVSAGIAKSLDNSGTNATGSSTWVEMFNIVKVLQQICPAKRIGVLYTDTEKQTIAQLESFRKLQDTLGIMVIAANVAKPEDAANAAQSLVNQRVDAVFITGGTAVGKGIPAILEVINKAKIPTAAHLPDRVKKGVLLAVSGDAFKIGELAGKKAAQVLKGTKPSEIPIESLTFYDITINADTAQTIGLVIPAKLLESAKEIIKK
ncbi:MAG: ABC transporter substrate-binding protein [Candidatus Omnitrophica bacterium]|nr:ABC transporter substrate-binding protein [Candidatus Omnitrophota bacterium]